MSRLPDPLPRLCLVGLLALVTISLALPLPAGVGASDPTLDAAQMTFEAARTQATIHARATTGAYLATQAAIRQTDAAVAIQQTQAAVEQTRVAAATRQALEAQATHQALDLTATAQRHAQAIGATQTAIALQATGQAIEAAATAGAIAAQVTRQALDDQEVAEQRQRTGNVLRLAGAAALAACVVAILITTGLMLRRRSPPQPIPAGQEPVEPQAAVVIEGNVNQIGGDESGQSQPAGMIILDVPRTRVIYGQDAEDGARVLSQWLELQEDYDDEPGSES